MRITCTKHAVYQGVKQGCDILHMDDLRLKAFTQKES